MTDHADVDHTPSMALKSQSFVYNDAPIRIVSDGGCLWFVLPDVCKVLGVGNAADVAARLDAADRRIVSIDTSLGPRDMIVVSEAGFYDTVLRSRKPVARPFQLWVTREVLPAIRQTGSYVHTPGATLPGPALTIEDVREAIASAVASAVGGLAKAADLADVATDTTETAATIRANVQALDRHYDEVITATAQLRDLTERVLPDTTDTIDQLRAQVGVNRLSRTALLPTGFSHLRLGGQTLSLMVQVRHLDGVSDDEIQALVNARIQADGLPAFVYVETTSDAGRRSWDSWGRAHPRAQVVYGRANALKLGMARFKRHAVSGAVYADPTVEGDIVIIGDLAPDGSGPVP